MAERLLYSQEEAAALLCMSSKRLRQKVRDGEIRYVLDGKRRKFTPGDLTAYVDAHRMPEGQETWGSTPGRIRRSSGGRSRSTVVGFAVAAARLRGTKRGGS